MTARNSRAGLAEAGTARRRRARALALSCSVLFALALVEAGLRVGFPAETRHYLWPPGMRKVMRPSPRYMPGVEGDAHFDVNSQGVRGPEIGPDTEYRVLALGGSTTECLYLDTDKAWPALVGAALTRTPDGRPVWIGNAGKAGMSSRDHVPQLKYLADEMPRLDTVVMLLGVNDVTVTLAQGDHYELPPPIADPEAEKKGVRRAFAIAPGRFQDLSTDEIGTADAPFYKHTALYQLARRTRALVTNQISAHGLAEDEIGAIYGTWRDHRRHASALIDTAPDLTEPLVEYRRNLGFLADAAAARNIRLVLVTQPMLWRRDLPQAAVDLLWMGGQDDFQANAGKAYYTLPVLVETMRRYNEALLDVCRERGLSCLDLAEKIPHETTMFYDDCHFTEQGSKAVAAAVSAYLAALPPFAPR